MLDKQKARQEIALALKRYESYKEGKLAPKETATRTDLIEPLFQALGWKVNDSFEVSKEEKVSKGFVDYGFKINGIPKFFLEAKELNEDLDGYRTVSGIKTTFAEQAISYAWIKHCTWAVLTNFKELRLYNAETREAKNIWFALDCDDFLSKEGFEQLLLLSRESFEQNLIDKVAERWGKRSKKLPIDKQLLADFMRFRALLSKNISKLNQTKNITQEDLDESIQRILDRLIFIRNCEDMELEAKELLAGLREREGRGKGNLIKSLQDVFAYFNAQYNSKLFANHLCDKLDIDDDILHKIIDGLYYTKDQSAYYDFSAIESDVLGNIYEQYLGHILKKSKKGAKVKDSPTHRKQQGIYYTPTYIVNYIVRNTLGELLKDKNIDVEKIRVLDPACGSGSFLIKAFDVLHEHYAKHDKNYSQPQLDFRTGGAFTTKVRILKDHLFGVDLDKQAVEIAQLNLFLKIVEKGKILPYLEENLKCGNSLIDNPLIAGDKALTWEDNFKDVMQEGGFDIVIGNPPWGADIDDILDYLKKKYPNSTQEHKDIYKCFIEKGIKVLKEGGILGFIVPNTCLLQPRYKDIRLFLKKYKLLKIINLGEKVFESVEAPSCIIVVQNTKPTRKNRVKTMDLTDSKDNDYKSKALLSPSYIQLEQSTYDKTVDSNFVTFYRELRKNEKLLGDIMDCKDCGIKYQRIAVGMKEKGKNDLFERLFYEGSQKNKQDKKYIIGADLKRYNIDIPINRFMRYNFRSILKPNEIAYFNERYFNAPNKILWRQTADRPICSIRESGWFSNTLQVGILKEEYKEEYDLRYILALLNSKYLAFLYIQSVREAGRVFPQVKLNKIKQLPVKVISIKKQQPLIKLVDKMLSLNKRLNEIGEKRTDELTKIEDQLKAADQEIDRLVYELYGLTEEEIKIVEGEKNEKS